MSIPGGVPSGAVVFFNLTTCPTGWIELTEARGRVAVGLPTGGTLAGLIGTAMNDMGSRTISDVPRHTHGVNDPGHGHQIRSRNDEFNCSGDGSGLFEVAKCRDNGFFTWNEIRGMGAMNRTTRIAINSAGLSSVDVTIPYIQLLVCQKN